MSKEFGTSCASNDYSVDTGAVLAALALVLASYPLAEMRSSLPPSQIFWSLAQHVLDDVVIFHKNDSFIIEKATSHM